jgi:hypothetical protein
MPAMPPPITSADGVDAMVVSLNGDSNAALATAMRTKSLAFSVAFSGSLLCTQES